MSEGLGLNSFVRDLLTDDARGDGLQGYLAHKETHPPLGPP